jgi:hypothetical protein
MLIEINGLDMIITIHKKSKDHKNVPLMTLCEQILDIIDKEYSNQKELRNHRSECGSSE